MPQVIFRFWAPVMSGGPLTLNHPQSLTPIQVRELGLLVQPKVAKACSTETVVFTEADIEWLPEPFREGTLGNEDFELELRTFGKPERKIKLDEAGAHALKTEIIESFVALQIEINPERPLLWVLWVDPEGVHV